jgi:hypothetical protein
MELQWCSDHGLPHSALLDWCEEDRAKLAAFLLESNSRCQMCGTADWEWEEDRNAYEPMVKQCWGCYVKDRATDENDRLPGSTMTLVPSQEAEKLRSKANHLPTRKG